MTSERQDDIEWRNLKTQFGLLPAPIASSNATYQVAIFSRATHAQVREILIDAACPERALTNASRIILKSEYAGSAYRY